MLQQPSFIGQHNKLASQQFIGQHTTTNLAGQNLNTQNVQNMSNVQGKQQHLQLLLHQQYRQLLNKRQLLQNLTLQPVALQQQMLQQQKQMMILQKNQLSSLQDESGAVGDPATESGDWRDQLQADSRERIVNKMVDTLKIHFPFSGYEEPREHKKIAEIVEEEIYTAATSQHNYLLKIVLKMLTMVYTD
ncbi:putative coactivator CBP, KIX domain superfamily, mediator complex subunit 15, KIX [Helianthus anomalus]